MRIVSFSPVRMPSARCPDCNAELHMDGQISHADACQMWYGIKQEAQDDALWFMEHPEATARRRALTPLVLAKWRWLGFEPPADAYVLVTRNAAGAMVPNLVRDEQ